MIFKRAAAKLRAQDWTAIIIEVAIVCVGVFVGNEVSNWNQARLQKDQTERLLRQLAPELKKKIAFFESVKVYYGTTIRYSNEALKGWAGGSVNDNDFVSAAYQASQIYGLNMNAQNWGLTFGSDQLRNIDDAQLRAHLSRVLTADYDAVSATAVDTPYRSDVRKLIPNDMQVRIRSQCGDQHIYNDLLYNRYLLPVTCSLTFGPGEAARTANLLRAHPELANELNLHLSRLATYLEDTDGLERSMRQLERDLETTGGGKS